MTATKKFGTVTRRKPNTENKQFKIDDIAMLQKKDRRMRFNNARDPIYYIFDCIENRPVKTLAKEFVRDSFFEITNFVSKVVR